MSNHRNRQASTKPSGGELPVNSKSDLVYMLSLDGYSLETEKRNTGEWNEGTNYYASKNNSRLLLDNALKGDRRDWQGMWNYFKSENS